MQRIPKWKLTIPYDRYQLMLLNYLFLNVPNDNIAHSCFVLLIWFTFGLGSHDEQNGSIMYIMKNGSQQTMKVVTTTAIVRAARRSLAICCLAFSLMKRCIASLSWGFAWEINVTSLSRQKNDFKGLRVLRSFFI